MLRGTCSIHDCDRTHEAKGFCRKHYLCWKRTGNPLARTPVTGCAIDGCEAAHYAKGWCKKHYTRVYDHGDPNWQLPTAEQRFWSKAHRQGSFDCWPWLGNTRNGYGEFTVRFDRYRAHRYSYELTRGPIPAGMVIDHLCRNTLCVNPDHLEVVSRGLNVLRGIGPSAQASRRSTCKHGHEYTPENTRINAQGHRACRTCDRENARKRRQEVAV